MKLLVGTFLTFILILNDLQTCVENLDIKKWNLRNYQNKRSIDAAVTRYYEKKTFLMSISVYIEYSQLWQNYVMDFLSEALTDSKFMKYEIFTKTTNRWQPRIKVSNHNLWYVDSFKAFSSLLQAVQPDDRDKVGEYVVIMDTATTLNKQQEVKLILEKSFEINIVNIVVAVFDGRSAFVLYSYDIFKPHHCWQVEVEQVNFFQHGKFQNEELFPYKFNNFHGCPLTMYIRNSSLFFRFNLTDDGSQIATIEGVEAKMLQTMVTKLNFTLNMLYTAQDGRLGYVYENGTALGAFRYLAEKKLDVVLGYYHSPIRNHYFGESISYEFMPLVIVLHEFHENDFTPVWLFKPFKPTTWLLFGSICLLVVLLVQFSHYYFNKTLTWLDVAGLVLNHPRPIHLKRCLTKVSCLLCIFGIMIFCAIFQGRLYSAFNMDHAYKIASVQELVERNYTFLITRRFDKDVIRSFQIPFEQIHFMDVAEDYWIYEKMLQYSGNTATFTPYWDFLMYIDSKKCYDEFGILPKIIIQYHICAYARNQSYLIEPMNRIIGSLKHGGIVKKWLQDLTHVDKTNVFNPRPKYQLSKAPLPLTTKKLEIVFAGLMSLYMLTMLIFLAELVVSNRTKLVRNCKKIMC